ncbi:dihydropteroate synthase [Hydrogenovibrio halophilus]|uniref:dihydropteroate synthase n=1 Tax=Hydrogenovibrio halophilus TaxID=373391 RepID=UPI000369490E|nr:dihydropteroate synthase [Hydrogenovibrio halophilus]
MSDLFLHRLDQSKHSLPLVMGILNVTPDSFSDGGQFEQKDALQRLVDNMLAAGADMIDVGGESTRPGAVAVGVQEELDRVMPVVEWLRDETSTMVSVDTTKPAVMQEAARQGVDLINDVHALQAEGAVSVVAESGVPVCLMHHPGSLERMHECPDYVDGVEHEVARFLLARARACEQSGIASHKILLDPGFGFGKTLDDNVRLFREMNVLAEAGYPLLVGVSRKRMIGALTGQEYVQGRVTGSVVAAVLAMMKGARILRVHDVAETVQGLKTAQALW